MSSNWFRGYGNSPPDLAITVGFSRGFLEQNFESCELATRLTNPNVLQNSSVAAREVFMCRRLRQPWPVFWQGFRTYG